jgi:hypothetical protein
VVSIRLGDPANLASLRALRRRDPSLRFKLDPTPSWDDDLLAELAPLAPDLYRRVFERLPDAWIEDPAVADRTIALLDRLRNRITWDEPIHSVGDIEALPWPPRTLNLKPARFGRRSPLQAEPHQRFRRGSHDGRPASASDCPGRNRLARHAGDTALPDAPGTRFGRAASARSLKGQLSSGSGGAGVAIFSLRAASGGRASLVILA